MPTISIGRLRGGFCVYWAENGKRRRFSLKARSRKEAEVEAVAVYRSKLVKPAGPTVLNLWSAFRDDYKDRRIGQNMEWSGRAILPYFGALRPEQIHAETCERYTASRRKDGVKDGTIHTELGHLRTCLRWAERMSLIARAPYIKRPTKPTPRERWLTREELVHLIECAKEPHVRLAILIMGTTAARIGAVLDLTWDRVDFERRQINLRLTESFRKGRAIVPINNTLYGALAEAQKAALTDYVVEWAGKPIKSIKKGFKAACERAELENVTPHDIRRTAARLMVEGGIPMREVAQYLGHTNEQVTYQIYARYSPEYMQDAADVLDFASYAQVHRTKGRSA